MKYYSIKIGNIKRELPIVALSPKMKVASFNLLGDLELVNVSARRLCNKIKNLDFDLLVGPEVKVVPLIHEMSNILKLKRYVVCRKNIMGYMVNPIKSDSEPSLVLDGRDAKHLKNKKVIIVDDVISTGKTLKVVENLMNKVGAKVVCICSIFKQGNKETEDLKSLIFLQNLPVFKTEICY